MSDIARFFRELRNPVLRCERLGHCMKFTTRRGHAYPSARPHWYVADYVTQKCECCTRCDYSTEWITINRDGLTGYTMPMDMEAKLRAEGFV